jgi:hypothetical protein
MRKLLFGLFLTCIACAQNSNNQGQVKSAADIDKYIGVYEFVYPYNTRDLIENHFIVLTKTDNKIAGLYYGTSDEFDVGREGYFPGFFVSPMEKLEIHGDTIRFTLNTKNSDFLTQSVDLRIKSTKAAIDSGYKNWGNKIPTRPRTYVGVFKDSVTMFFRGEREVWNKTFKRK